MRRISYWQKRDRSGAVKGVALQDLGFECFAVYVSANVVPLSSGRWLLVLDRAGFLEQRYEEPTRHRAMMRAEHEIAVQWGKPTPTTYANDPYANELEVATLTNTRVRTNPDPVPLADTKKWAFWKKKAPMGPKPEPAYMKLLTPEMRRAAKLPAGEAWREVEKTDNVDRVTGLPYSPEVQKLRAEIREKELELERLEHGDGMTPEQLAAAHGSG